MGATKATLISMLRDRLSSTTDDALLTASTLLTDLNNGLAAFADERDWPWLDSLTTVAITANSGGPYSLPSGYTHVHSMSINNIPIDEVVYDEYLGILRQQATGQPKVFTRVADTFYLAPVPRNDYTLNVLYQHEERVLSGDTDQTYAPTRFASIITTYAAIYSAVRIRDNANINMMYQLRKDELQRVYDAMQLTDIGPRIEIRSDMRA